MASELDEIRQQYPEYAEWSDQKLGRALKKKAQPDMPDNEYWTQLGVDPNGRTMGGQPLPEPEKTFPEKMENFYRASGIHGANKGFANIFGFGQHVQNANEAANRASETHPFATGAGEFAADVYSSIPFFMAGGQAAKAIPGVKNLSQMGKFGKYFQNIIGTGIGGGALEGMHSVGENESRLGNIGSGSAVAAGIEAAIPALKYAAKPIKKLASGIAQHGLGLESSISKEVLKGLTPLEAAEAGNVYDAGKRLGVQLTPAEASGSPILGQVEGKLGTTDEGQQAYMQFKKAQKAAQEKAVKDLLKDVSPSRSVASGEVRDAAKGAIEKDRLSMLAKAEPYYTAAEKEIVKPNTLNTILADSNVAKAWDEVLKDPLYATELEGFPKNSIKVLDLVKRNLDDKIGSYMSSGNRDAASIVRKAKEKLVSQMDKASPNYGKARQIYGDEAKVLEALQNSNVGKIAGIADTNLKNIPKVIFDPQQTDIKVLKQVRDRVTKEDPEAWAKIIRNEMERRLDSKLASKTRNSGSNFYDQIVGTDRNFEQFHTALEGNPAAQAKLSDMRDSFRNLLNSYTVKTAGGQAKSSLDMPRSGPAWYLKWLQEFTGGQYDQGAVDIITNPKWRETYLPKITAKSNISQQKEFLEKLGKVSKDMAKKGITSAANKSLRKGDE